MTGELVWEDVNSQITLRYKAYIMCTCFLIILNYQYEEWSRASSNIQFYW